MYARTEEFSSLRKTQRTQKAAFRIRIRIHPDPLHLAGSGSTSIPAPDPDPGPLRFLSSNPDPDPLKKALIREAPKLFRVIHNK